jgi:hypothetical protein
MTLPALAANIFWALDLALFGASAKLKQAATGELEDQQITELVQRHEQTATSITIRETFRRASLDPNIGI